MPATERSFTVDFPPAHLYLDTDLFFNVIKPSDPHHARSVAFLQRLIDHGLTQIYLSTVSWVEIIHRATREQYRLSLPPSIRQQYRLDQWHSQDVRNQYIQELIQTVEDILAPFEWVEISVTPDIFRVAAQLMGQYNLEGQDAIHLACMQSLGIMDIASFDKKFRRVEGIYLWNDCIYINQPDG